MSDNPDLGIYFTPSPSEAIWREALLSTATSAGWRVNGAGPTAATASGKAPGTLWFASCETDVSASAAVDWLVFGDSPSAALAAAVSVAGGVMTAPVLSSAIWHTAQRFATASVLASNGARVLDAAAMALDLPRLGVVRRADAATTTPTEATALDVYLTLPPVSGAKALWQPDLFTYPAGRMAAAPLQVDLTGRPRILVYGPHIDLPPGNWRATVRLDVDPEGGQLRLRLEWGQGTRMATASVTIKEPGRYAIRLNQDWLDPGAAEMRLWLDEASFGGRLTLLDVQVERL